MQQNQPFGHGHMDYAPGSGHAGHPSAMMFAQYPPQQPQQPYYPQGNTHIYPPQYPGNSQSTGFSVKPTWKLAWGLLWRWFFLVIPFYGVLLVLMLALKH